MNPKLSKMSAGVMLALCLASLGALPSDSWAMGIDGASKTPATNPTVMQNNINKKPGTIDSTFIGKGAGAVPIPIPTADPEKIVDVGGELQGVSFWSDEFRFNNKNTPALLTKTAADVPYTKNTGGGN